MVRRGQDKQVVLSILDKVPVDLTAGQAAPVDASEERRLVCRQVPHEFRFHAAQFLDRFVDMVPVRDADRHMAADPGDRAPRVGYTVQAMISYRLGEAFWAHQGHTAL